jgi:hypothetical protein
MTRIGGKVPDSYGLSLTVRVPTATEAAPVNAGDILNFTTTGSYTAAPAAAGGAIQLVAKHPVSDGLTPLGVYVYGFSRVDVLEYSGTAPALGASVEADGAGGVRTAAAANGTRVLHVDTTRSLVEVALP